MPITSKKLAVSILEMFEHLDRVHLAEEDHALRRRQVLYLHATQRHACFLPMRKLDLLHAASEHACLGVSIHLCA